MSVVKIFAFLELKQKFAFFKGFNAFCSDRSSDFPALLAAFPFVFEKWHNMAKRVPFSKDLYKTSLFALFLRQTQILILEILNVLLWLKFSPSLNLNKNKHFSKASFNRFPKQSYFRY